MAGLGRDLHDAGFDVLLFDLRGHGQSDPSRLYLGRRERNDIRAVMDWAESEGFTHDRIGWLGYSMGGSTLLMEACPQSGDPGRRVRQPVRRPAPACWTRSSASTADCRAGSTRASCWRPVGSTACGPTTWSRSGSPGRGASGPLLLIHGESDTTVPVGQARELARTLGASCLTLTLPGVEHVQAYQSDPDGYVRTVGSFFDAPPQPVNGSRAIRAGPRPERTAGSGATSGRRRRRRSIS